jgi:phosphate starvation-inducible protein PhoH
MTKRTGNNRVKKWDKGQQRSLQGDQLLKEDRISKEHDNDWNLGWFEPKGLQNEIVESIGKNVFTIVDAPSGCGKTSTALWKALMDLKDGNYNQLVFAKNPTEVGDDKIGFLSGNEQDKLQAHYETTKLIFQNFMSPEKLENDIKHKIRLTIPNFLLGATFDNCIVILDEAQVMSPDTMKLLLERCGLNTKYVILGDSGQRYSISKRQDGFKDLIERTTVEHQCIRISTHPGMFGYVKMSRHDNQRSDGSKFINKLYGEDQ